MKIAIPVKNNDQIDNHFGHCESYAIYSISEENKITAIDNLPSKQGCGCKSDIAQVLADQGVSVMLAGGIGNGAINVLKSSGIEVVRGCSGNTTALVNQYILGILRDSGESCTQHDHDHVCTQ